MKLATYFLFGFNITMIKSIPAPPQTKELFCHKYWRQMKKRATSNPDENRVGLFDYSDFNLVTLGINSDKPSKPLRDLDLSFRMFEPSKKAYVTWRGVSDPSCLYADNKTLVNYFNKCKNVQVGETLCMKEFPYVSASPHYAKSFISNNAKDYVNILFEIEIPKGTRFYNNCDRNVLQRSSRFMCTDTKRVQDKDSTYQHIKLTLLPRENQPDTSPKPNLIQRILNKVGLGKHQEPNLSEEI